MMGSRGYRSRMVFERSDAIHKGHLHIGQDEIIVVVDGKDIERFDAGGGKRGGQVPLLQLVLQDSPVGEVVVDDEQSFAGVCGKVEWSAGDIGSRRRRGCRW